MSSVVELLLYLVHNHDYSLLVCVKCNIIVLVIPAGNEISIQ